MRLRPTALLLLGLATALVGLDVPAAGADCSGPQIECTAGMVDRGQEITVTGRGFGDSCYDTGPPPPGVGAMGQPLDDIDVVITQAGVDHLVAKGEADAEYEFEVDVVVPARLEPGEARLQVRWGPGTAWAVDRTDQPLVVSDIPAAGDDVVATFGPQAEPAGGEPAAAETARPSPSSASGSGWSEPGRWIVAAMVLLAVVGIGSMVLVRRR
jgi:hypothetical protein